MKKHILLGAALLSLFAASCSNEHIINNGTEVVTGKAITLNANINNGADTRLTYKDDANNNKMTVAWSDDEKFTMYQGTSSTPFTFSNSADNTGKFTCDSLEEGEGTYYAVYGEDITNSAGTLTIDLSGDQVGTSAENGIKEFMLASADTLTSETTLSFDHKLTVLKMTLTLPEDVEGTVNKVTVSGLHNKAIYDLSKTANAYTYIDDNKGDITATNGFDGFAITENKITAYVAVFPENVSANQVTIKATVGDNEYSYTIASKRTLAAAMVVPVNVTVVKRNFKSVYSTDDYKKWSTDNCGSAPTVDQMRMYLGAGVYWDDGTAGPDQQTYTLPDGGTYHTGLWLMKKEYISGFSAGTANKLDDNGSATPTQARPADINKYFFLPATGYYIDDDFKDAGPYGYYWSDSTDVGDYAYFLFFYNSCANLQSFSRDYGLLPMIAE